MLLYPATVQSTYANLVQSHLNRPAFEFSGAPFTRERRGKTYWYVNQRVAPGAPPRQRYLGPDSDSMRARIEDWRASSSDQADFKANASRQVAQLRAAGLPTLDRQTGSILRALSASGVFRLGGTLVGTHAFRCYPAILGMDLMSQSADPGWLAQTEDLDIASFEKLSVAIEDVADPDVAETLKALGFSPRNALDPKKPTSWTLPDGSYSVDFLTPAFSDDVTPARLDSMGIWAQRLHYLNFLLRDPIPAVVLYMEGLLVQVPSPERFAIHKLIVSQKRRPGAAKANKDLEQARALINALAETRPQALYDALEEADSEGPNWRTAIDHALALTFNAPELRHDPRRDIISFEGRALQGVHLCSISAEALEDHFSAESWNSTDLLSAARRNRGQIEAIAQSIFRRRPGPETLIRSEDVEERASE